MVLAFGLRYNSTKIYKNLSSTSILKTDSQQIISLGMDLNKINTLLGLPSDTIQNSGNLLILVYGDHFTNNIKIGFKNNTSVLFKLNQFSGEKFKINKGVKIGMTDVDFWKTYNIPDDMSYHDKQDVRGVYIFKIWNKNKMQNLTLLNDQMLEKNEDEKTAEDLYYLDIRIDYKNFSNSIKDILICHSDFFQEYRNYPWPI